MPVFSLIWLGLFLDSNFMADLFIGNQWLTNIIVFAFYIWIFVHASKVVRKLMLYGLLVATGGEILFSLILGMYIYRPIATADLPCPVISTGWKTSQSMYPSDIPCSMSQYIIWRESQLLNVISNKSSPFSILQCSSTPPSGCFLHTISLVFSARLSPCGCSNTDSTTVFFFC